MSLLVRPDFPVSLLELPDHLQLFRLKEFFETLEKAIDRCGEAGVVAYQIVLKNS